MIPAGTPGWRRPYGKAPVTAAELRASERQSLGDAIRQLLPRTHAELLVAVREDWGRCSSARLDRTLRWHLAAGVIRLSGDVYDLAGGER